MDIDILQKQYKQPTDFPSSIALQNHIYGCFILMEDIAQGAVTFDGTRIKNDQYVFLVDTLFEYIGVRYGFLFDTKLILESLPEYKMMWVSIFKSLSDSKKIEDVDAIEEVVIAWVQKTIAAEDSYFIHALETGVLSQVWLGKVLALLLPDAFSGISCAKVEKPLTQSLVQPSSVTQSLEKPLLTQLSRPHFARTRRNHGIQSILKKKHFAYTRKR